MFLIVDPSDSSPFEIRVFTNPFLVGAVLLFDIHASYCHLLRPSIRYLYNSIRYWAWIVILTVTGGGMLVRWCLYWIRKTVIRSSRYGKLENIGTSTT